MEPPREDLSRERGSPRDARRLLAERGGLYLILTGPRIPHRDLAIAAAELRVPVVQLREKEMDDDELVDTAAGLVEITRDTETLLLVNDRPDVALRAGADGVHVGREDMPQAVARKLLGEHSVVGVTGNTVEEAHAARAGGADYLGAGPVFPTETKPDAKSPIGPEGLREVVGSVPGFPVVAIGGITADSVGRVMETGARYAAVVSAICRARDPVAALEAMTREIGKVTG
ncbi:MAG: thiamine phosphate synthase [Candidatus Eisenbacteria bacterium]|nr:thiamine phosphate synthase [Candidatus Eisenbacteria bacterium]